MVSDLTFKSSILFEFLFCIWHREWSTFILLHEAVKFPSLIYWRHGLLPIVYSWLHCVHSVQFSRSVVYDSEPHGLQHARLPCPSSTPGVCLNSCTASHWCHPTISPSVVHFSSCLQSFPASGSFPMSQFFVSGDQSIGVSASASVLQWIFRTGFL